MQVKQISMLVIFTVNLIACGSGQNNNNNGKTYYSASHDSYYQIESSTESGSATQLLFSIQSTGGSYVNQTPLTYQSANSFTFAQNGATGTVTLNNGNLGVSYQTTSSTWIDFATQNISNIALPAGTYNLVCDQNNLSACQAVIANNTITITEYSVTGQPTQLCGSVELTKTSDSSNPYLSQFTCGVNGGATAGTWFVAPLTIANTTALMMSEFNPTINTNDDQTDEIAFPLSQSINPLGTYNYVYSGGTMGGVGNTTAQFTQAGLINSIIGTCAGAACALIQNQYYNNNQIQGVDWYNVNGLNNYNLVGNDAMNIYQDSFYGFYF